MYKPQKAQKVFLIAIIFSLVVLVLYCFILIKILRENKQIAELNGNIGKLVSEKEALVLLKKQVMETMTVRNKINSYFLAADGMVAFLSELQAMGNENNLNTKINSVSIVADPPVSTGIFEMANVTVGVEGLWSDVYRFATLVELMPFGVSVNGVDLERVGDKLLWEGMIDVNVLKLK